MVKQKKGMSVGKEVAIGAGIAAVGAGAYYLFGPKGKQHQRKAKAWAVEMEKDVEKKINKVKSITEPIYHNVIDTIAVNYSKKYKENKKEIDALAKKLKGEWKNIKNKTRPIVKKVKRIIK